MPSGWADVDIMLGPPRGDARRVARSCGASRASHFQNSVCVARTPRRSKRGLAFFSMHMSARLDPFMSICLLLRSLSALAYLFVRQAAAVCVSRQGDFAGITTARGCTPIAAQARVGRAPASATPSWSGSSTTSSPWLGAALRWGSETRTWAHAPASTLWSIPVREAGPHSTVCRLAPPFARTGLSSHHAPRNRGLLGAVPMCGTSMCSTPRASMAPGWYLRLLR